MSYRVEKNPKNGVPEIIIDGWEKGIADSPYGGITRMLNLNPWWYTGALYSNYTRVSAGTPTIGLLAPFLFTSSNPNGYSNGTQFIIADRSGNTFSATGGVGFSTFNSNAIPTHSNPIAVSGICYYSPTNYPTSTTEAQFCFAWGEDTSAYLAMYYSKNTGSGWSNWAEVPAWSYGGGANPIITEGTPQYAIWAKDNNMYICNGRYVTLFGLTYQGVTISDGSFDPSGTNGTNYILAQQAITLPAYENATWLGELGDTLLIASGNRIYPFAYGSFQTSTPIQFSEPVNKFIVINNLIYALCGQKGNIYISNTYSWSLFKHIPDSFFGVTDPTILWGGIMFHRNKLYVGITETKTLISGIFSIDLDTKAVNFENQNSFGLTATATPTYGQPEILFDYNSSGSDSYYSAWYNNSAGGVNDSSTTSYTDGSTFIETDLIPTGTYLTQTTPIQVEFKLDTPMTSGDSITIYGRKHFSDSYVQFGSTFTSTGIEVGWVFPSSIQNNQWLQLKVVLTTASGNSVRLREVRLRQGQ